MMPSLESGAPSTMIGLLRRQARHRGDQPAYTFLADEGTDKVELTYGELDRRSRAIGASLQLAGATGEPVLLLYPHGLEFITAFWGCLYAGAIAVPAYPPKLNRSQLRLQRIIEDTQAAVALTTQAMLERAGRVFSEAAYAKSLKWLATDVITSELGEKWREPAVNEDTLAMIQYTSGSTSAPKGVMVSHGNLLSNERMIQQAFHQTEGSVVVGWLPLYHDMGLIGNALQPLYLGARCVLMSPTAFLQKPFRWLRAISDWRATVSGGPNFAYDLCARKVSPEERAQLDLSSWTVAFNGAEPISHETMERFAATFAGCGFRREAFYPCYGLAEATLLVSAGPNQTPRIEQESSGRISVGSTAAHPGQRIRVGCGRVLPSERLVIVDPESSTPSPAEQVGEIWVSGPNVARGYWNRDQETEQTFRAYLGDTGEGPFLRTGDLGYIKDGELFVVGRIKDLIIIRGRNHYPQDIELTVQQSAPALESGGCAAFSIEQANEERLVIVKELSRGARNPRSLIETIREAVAGEHEIQAQAVALVDQGSIPKTTSGKIQRSECRNQYQTGGLATIVEWHEHLASEVEPVKRPSSSGLLTIDAIVIERIEQSLASFLAAKLGRGAEQIGIDQPLYRLGSDSLTAVELSHHLESRFGVVLTLASLLEEATIAQLARRALEQMKAASNGPESGLARAPKDVTAHPLSYGQRSLWFLYHLAPRETYNVWSAVRIRSALNPGALRRALQKIVDRHDSLRTTFLSREGEPLQRIHDRLEVSLLEMEVSAWNDQSLDEHLVEEAHRPFNLEQGPLLRASLFTRSPHDHILLVVAHHIVVDLWSMGVLIHELGRFYRAEMDSTAAPMDPLPAQYVDYVYWQSDLLSGQEGERLWSYWERQLAGELGTLNLPTDRPRSTLQTFRGETQLLSLSPEMTQSLRSLGQDRRATLYMVLQAVFQVLLHRYTAQEEIIVGSPAAGRSKAELARLIGYFVNPIVLRADISGHPTFSDHLERVREITLAALAHQDYPFALLVERLQPARDPSRSPLFQVMFALQQAPSLGEAGRASPALVEGARLNFGGLSAESMALRRRTSYFDLSLFVIEAEGGLKGFIEYNADLFDEWRIRRMAEHFRTLIGAVTANPERRIGELDLMSKEEKAQALVEFNRTQQECVSERRIHQLFERQVESIPDAVALTHQAGQLTYLELNARANQLARCLRRFGAGAETLVGICAERSLEMVVGLLGILKAGGAYLPLDPAYPAERIAFMLEDAQAKALLAQPHLFAALPAGKALAVPLDAGRQMAATESAENLPGEETANNLAYVIYTSGSTGRPKGVSVAHRQVINFFTAMDAYLEPDPTAVWLAVTSICFDISVLELLWTLGRGFRVVIQGERSGRAAIENEKSDTDGEDLSVPAQIARHRISHLQCTPSMAGMLCLETGSPDSLSSLRKLMIGGETLSTGLAESLKRLTPAEIRNLYGPTETAVWSTTYTLGDVGGEGASIPIGRPVANTQIYLLGQSLQMAPVGVPGELYIGGKSVVRGYLKQPALTAERFLPDPFSPEPGARLYRTGDLARYLADGNIEFLGRIDHQVKIRGFRIELGEIEARLGSHPKVRQCVVMTHRDEAAEMRLVAYVVSEDEGAPGIGELRGYLKERLPEYMLPAWFVRLEQIPLMPNGKVDCRALPAPEMMRSETREGYAAPRTPVEEMMVGIFEEVLKLDRVGIRHNFFELGGHSLLATQVVSRVRKTFETEIGVRVIFEEPTVEGLARRIERAMEAGGKEKAPPLVKAVRGARLPLSFAQQRLWFLDQLAPDNPFYNISGAVRLEGRLEIGTLEGAINEIVRRHESLRTRIEIGENEPVQVIDQWKPRRLKVEDLTSLPQEEREAEARRVAREEAMTGFDLSRGPLLRVKVLKLEADEHVLLFIMHHIVSDGWSLGILIREVGTLYSLGRDGEKPSLPEMEIQYADYAVWQRDWLQGEVLERQLSYWRGQMAGLAPLELPTDYPRLAPAAYRGASLKFELSEDLTQRLHALSRQAGVTLFMTLLGAFQTLLMRYSGQEEIAVGSPIANRTRAETEGLIGFFVNTLVLRTKLERQLSFQDLLGRVREVCLGAYAHQDLPFEQVVEHLQPERDLSRQPLFQVMFVLQNAPAERLKLLGLKWSNFEIPVETSKFDLLLSAAAVEDRLGCDLNYNRDLFEAATIKRLAGHLERLLSRLAPNPHELISEIEYLTEEERRQILEEWNDTRREYRRESCLHELIEETVAQRPEAVAVIHGDAHLSYQALNVNANRLARYLQRLGLSPEAPVGMLMERRIEMIVSMLAILKAGGAYAPLDPDYPLERLMYLLEDTGISVLLTQEGLRERVAPYAGRCFYVDAEWERLNEHSAANLNLDADANNLAYIIHTSGSSGTPKGVAVPQRAVSRLVLNTDYVKLDQTSCLLQLASPTFDAATFEIWGALLHGGRLVMAEVKAPSAADLERIIGQYGVETMWLTASLYNATLDEGVGRLRELKQLLIGGEALSVKHVRDGMERLDGTKLINGYGPTEGTTFTCCHRITAEDVVEGKGSVPIGLAIANTTVYVMDGRTRLLPVGVGGELYIGGDGLARCYYNQPEMTAEKFIPHPYSEVGGERLYGTGDVVRYLSDGKIEFTGRADEQVKLRGYRVELGEIEYALMQHPAVSQAVVMLRQDHLSDKRLVAYVVRDKEYEELDRSRPEDETSAKQVSQWQMVFDQAYHAPVAVADPEFNLSGWHSSYTGQPMPAEEMREWLDDTVDRILALRPDSVLEIGCGTGLILFRVAPYCRRYWGTDLSRQALDDLGRQLGSRPDLSQVTLFQRAAENFEGLEPESFDTVILNSVVQYFPSINYLADVLEEAVRSVKSGGSIFIGDVRSLPLLKAFHLSLELYQAPPSVSTREMMAQAQRRRRRERELIIDPAFFIALKRHLPRIKHVGIRLKGGRHHNELTKFRYEAILHISDEALPSIECPWMEWDPNSLSLPALERILSSNDHDVLAFKRVPNARLMTEKSLLQMLAADDGAGSVGDLRRRLCAIRETGIEPDDLTGLGRNLNYRVTINWSGDGGDDYFDAVFFRTDTWPGGVTPLPTNPLPAEIAVPGGFRSKYANDPLQPEASTSLIAELRSSMKQKLPDYMAPSVFVMMDQLPLTSNGKVDRRALPAPEVRRSETREGYTAPRTPIEEMVGGIFEEVLKLDRVGIRDNFFEIGGHSLLATQVISRVRKTFGVEIGVRSIFEDATVEGLVSRIEQAIRTGGKAGATPLVRVEREERLPLSFAQQRLWFLDQLVPDNPFYHCPGAMKLEGRLNLEVLETTINEIVRRHEALRTRIEIEAGEPTQVIDAWQARRLEIVDLTNSTRKEREEIRKIIKEEAGKRFDLSRGPLLRVKVLKLAEEEHILLFTMHHIVSDGWSIGVLEREISLLYEALSEERESPLPELEIQYADYAVWQRKYLTGELLESEIEYWKEQLKDAAVIDLPFDRARPADPTYQGRSERVEIGQELGEQLRRLSRGEGATLFIVLMAAFKVLLTRYSGEADVCVGAAVANRTRKEVEGLIGFFVNTLVLRTDLGGNPSFRELIRREREVALGAYAHQEAPFERLVEEINPQRDLSRSPLFQVMMALQNTRRDGLEMKGVKVSAVGEETGAAKLDLTLALTEDGEGLAGYLEYSQDLYEGETIRRMARHYERVLEEVVRDADQQIGRIRLMREREQRQILEEWNETERVYEEMRPVHELIAEQARQRGEAIAVRSEHGELSYRELDQRANRLAHFLKRKGIEREEVAGICAERSAEMVIAMLGVLKAGAAYLPIDGSYPEERIKYLLADAGVKRLLIHGPAARRLGNQGLAAETIDFATRWEEIAEEREDSPGVEVEADNLAYVIYTSGSTGRPKGVMISHGGLANYLKWATAAYRIAEGTGAPVNSSIGFDLTVTSLYGPLVNGKSVNLLPEDEGIEALATALRWERGYSLVKLTPSHLEVLAQQMSDTEVAGRTRAMVIGGEQLSARGLKYWQERARGTRLINEYGPTETVVGCCVYEVNGSECDRAAVPIGKPIANAQIYILDRESEPEPIGVRGEIYISGAGVARGYLEKPELTAERFIPNRFGGKRGARLYRTGDLGRYLSDGNIEFIGRTDDQVKVRGYRIELEEIHAALNEHRSVRQSIVVAREDESGGQRLLGYVVGEGGSAPALKRHLKERLPAYMVPETILMLEEMPMTANGKIDRKRLPMVESAGRRPEHAAARTPIEEMLVGIFEEVLKLEGIGIHDNFFEIGGHSLLATQVVSRVRKAFGVEFRVKGIFEEATVKGLAHRIEETLRAGGKAGASPLVRVEREKRLPLSFAQQRLWFWDQLAPNNSLYNIPGAVRLEGKLDLDVLEAVINEIVRRHEVLRTRIEIEEDETAQAPIQVIDDWEPRRLEIRNLTSMTPEERETEVRRIMSEEAGTGFDLRRGPMIRVKVLKLEEDDHVLLFTMHHIVSDGWSLEVLKRELSVLYEALSAGKRSPLPELEIQYADYAVWQRCHLKGQVLEEHLRYWKRQLGGKLPILELPGDHPRPTVPSYRGATKSLSLPDELRQSLKTLSQQEGATLFMVLLAAFKTLLYRHTAQEDLIIGTAIANRTRAEIEPLIGFFVNLLPMRIDLHDNPRFRELLRRVKEVSLGAYAHQDLPFEKLVEEIQPERELRRAPLFNIIFGVLNAPTEEVRVNGIKISPLAEAQESARFDLSLWITEGAGPMRAKWIYSTDLFEEETIRRLHYHFENLLFDIIDRPDARLTALKISPRSETGFDHQEHRDRENADIGKLLSIKPRGINLSTERP